MSDDPLYFSQAHSQRLERHLPPTRTEADAGPDSGRPGGLTNQQSRPFVTLTFATSLDSSLSLAPGTRTVLSGPQSKSMTHFLRSRHAAICVGVGTAEADDPGLNCRLGTTPVDEADRASQGAPRKSEDDPRATRQPSQPRPVVIDPQARWAVSENSKVMRLAREGRGLAPFVITATPKPSPERAALLERHGGKYIIISAPLEEKVSSTTVDRNVDDAVSTRMSWTDILAVVWRENLESIMIEGGGHIINSLLEDRDSGLIDSVIVTIAPTWLGQGGVVVSPARKLDERGNPIPAVRLKDVEWIPLGDDAVLCGKILR
jgi:2,5-diamino-6-(ribosylamino)-4(3H)-pyrimidinone 5'-phosphate reductase